MLAEVKADPSLRKIPVVVLTTSGAVEDVARSYDLHANVFVTKPVDFDHFTEVVKQIDDFFLTVAAAARRRRLTLGADARRERSCAIVHASGLEPDARGNGAAMTARIGTMSIDGTPISQADLARIEAEEKLHAEQQRSAVRVVAASALDAEDCRMLLSMLGLDREIVRRRPGPAAAGRPSGRASAAPPPDRAGRTGRSPRPVRPSGMRGRRGSCSG